MLETRQFHRTLEKTVRAGTQEFRLRAVSPEDPYRSKAIRACRLDIHGPISDHGRRRPNRALLEKRTELIALPNTDVASVHEVEVLPETKQLENLLGEIPSLRRAHSHVNPL